MRWKILLLLLLVPTLVVQASNGNGNAKGRARGKKSGGYTLKIAGEFTGTGTIAVSDINLKADLTITYSDGTTATIKFPNLKLSNDRFAGKSTGNPANAVDITGRVDLPSATDDQMTDEQAYTGRVMATLTDAAGKSASLVAVQDETSKGKKP